MSNKEQAPESLTVKEALEQGYTHYAAGNYEDDLLVYQISESGFADNEIRLVCEKQPKVLTVTPKDIYEPMADCLANDNEVSDEDDKYGDIIRKSVNWVQIAELINQALAKRPVYYPTDIKLIP